MRVLAFIGLLVLLIASVAPGASAGSSGELVTVTVMTYPERLPVIVDGVVYTPGQSGGVYSFRWEPGSKHTVRVLVGTVYLDTGSRLVFAYWNTGETEPYLTVTPEANTSIVAIYDLELFLSVETPYGHPTGQGWYPVGGVANVSVERVVALGDGVRAVFTRWSSGYDPTSNETSLLILEATTLRAEWRLEYWMNVSSSIGSQVYGAGWVEAGKHVVIAAPPVVDMGDVVYKFRAWNLTSGRASLEDPLSPRTTIALEGPASVVAEYDPYYWVTVSTQPGVTERVLVKEGDTLEAVVERTVINTGPGERLVFRGWSNGDTRPATSIIVDGPVVLRAEWGAQYLVSVAQGPVPVSGGGWYWAGETATIAAPREYDARLGARYVFSHWEGDASGGEPRISVRVTGPLTVEPVYEKDYTGTIGALALVAATGLGTVGLLWFSRRASSSLP